MVKGDEFELHLPRYLAEVAAIKNAALDAYGRGATEDRPWLEAIGKAAMSLEFALMVWNSLAGRPETGQASARGE